MLRRGRSDHLLPRAPDSCPGRLLSPLWGIGEGGHMIEPGTRCPTCDQRIPKPRKSTSPDTKRVVAVLPSERAKALSEALDALQAYVGADASSYPRGTILELLAIVGGQQREELQRYFAESWR